MDGLLIILYILLGYNANQYLRRTLLGQVGVIYFNTGYYIIRYLLLKLFYPAVNNFIIKGVVDYG